MTRIVRHIKIVGVVSLYHPTVQNISQILNIGKKMDKFLIRDDSEISYEKMFEDCYKKTNKRPKEERNIKYTWNGKNIGLCKSINEGIKEAVENADWILVLDQDSYFQNDVVGVYKNFINCHKIDKIDLLAPRYNYDRDKSTQGYGYKKLRMSMMSGSLMNVNALNVIGLYDERFYIDGLDYEWCLRARERGYDIIECSEAVINHHPADTRETKILGILPFKYGWHNGERYYYQFRSMFLINELYHNPENIMIFIYKRLKSPFLFGDFKAYNSAYIEAKADFKVGYFGKYRGILKAESGLSENYRGVERRNNDAVSCNICMYTSYYDVRRMAA